MHVMRELGGWSGLGVFGLNWIENPLTVRI